MPKPTEFNSEPQFIQPFGPVVTYGHLQTLEGISEFVKGARCPTEAQDEQGGANMSGLMPREYTTEELAAIQKIEVFLERWIKAEWGPAHIVLSDYNLDADFIEFSLKAIDNYNDSDYSEPHSPEELEATRLLLMELLGIEDIAEQATDDQPI